MKTIKIAFVLIFQFSFQFLKAQSFEGLILDKKDNTPIPFVEIYFVDLHTGTTTDDNGIFTIEHFNQKKIHLQITYIGYKTIDEIIDIESVKKKTFYLEESHYKLEEVLISTSTSRLQRESIVSVYREKMSELQKTAPITLAESISNIAGVEQNTTGVGIGKPIIRGLSGNRIVTYAQGIRIENQQFGDEHGLGVGEIGIESVEVIKGPASLLYGSDALGGVLFFVDERYTKHDTYETQFQSKFLSNTLSTINDIGFKIHKGEFKFNVFASYASHADYQLPNNNRVFNTRFDEKNVKTAFGFNSKNWISNIRYSFLQNNFGITEGASINNSTSRKFELPFQTINNHNISIENNFTLNDSKLKTTLGYTSNYRREFEDDRNEQALGMYLNTFTYNLKWNSPIFKERFDFIIGSQGMFQKNNNNGEEILIPNANTTDLGLFTVANLKWNKLQLQAGLRFDNRKIDTKTTDNILAFENSYSGTNFSFGAVYKQEKTKFRANISSGFRAPNTSELLSDGVHEGTNRYEKGNRNLTNENATQIDFSFDYSEEHFKFSVNPFYNYIKNYIFLTPTGNTIDSDPEFEYLQTNAFLYGGEMGFHYHPHHLHWLHLESTVSTVFAEDSDRNSLPLIPQTKLNTRINTEFSANKKWSFTSVYLQHIYKFKQPKISIFETETKNYHLINLGTTIEIQTKNNPIKINTGIKNVLNTKYTDHLSRFKNLGIQNQGINFYFGVAVSFSNKLNTP